MGFETEQIGECTLYCGDARAVLAAVSGIDVVLTDPPWGIEGGKGTRNVARGKGVYEASFPDTPAYIAATVVPIIQHCMAHCRAVIVTPGTRCMTLYPGPDSFGVMYCPAATSLQSFGMMDASPIFYYGKSPTGRNWHVPCSMQVTEAPEKNGHPCPKPLKTWTKLLQRMSQAGQVIGDPFMGSGTTGVAAVHLGLAFVGIELERRYFDIACARLHKAHTDRELYLPALAVPVQQGLF